MKNVFSVCHKGVVAPVRVLSSTGFFLITVLAFCFGAWGAPQSQSGSESTTIADSVVPHLVTFAGTLRDSKQSPVTGAITITQVSHWFDWRALAPFNGAPGGSTRGSLDASYEGLLVHIPYFRRVFTVRLLLVEGDLAIQRFVAQALGEAGYLVDAAPDAKRAEALALRHVYASTLSSSSASVLPKQRTWGPPAQQGYGSFRQRYSQSNISLLPVSSHKAISEHRS